jgi:hypothetical protein
MRLTDDCEWHKYDPRAVPTNVRSSESNGAPL